MGQLLKKELVQNYWNKNSEGFDRTNLEPVDISVDSDSDDSLSVLDPRRLRDLVDSEKEIYSENDKEKEKEKEKENCTDNIFATGGQQVRVSMSPATGNIYLIEKTLSVESINH